MRRAFYGIGVLAIFLLASARADEVSRVTFDAVVTGKGGHPVVGLAKHHFKVFEDGVQQTITSFGTHGGPGAIVVVLEYSDSFTYYDEVAGGAAGFIRSLQPKDWIALVTFGIRPEIVSDFTRDKKSLLTALNRLWTPLSKETAFYDAVYFVLERLEGVEGKKAILLLSTGMDTVSRRSYIDTLKKAEASDTMIYSVNMAQFARSVTDPYVERTAHIRLPDAENAMRAFAEATGGLVFYPRFSGEYRRIYETVSADLLNRYSLGFASTHGKSIGKVRVEVMDVDVNFDGKPDKLKVRHGNLSRK